MLGMRCHQRLEVPAWQADLCMGPALIKQYTSRLP